MMTTLQRWGVSSERRTRVPHGTWSRLKATPAEVAVVYSLIGMDTSPNEIVPEPIE